MCTARDKAAMFNAEYKTLAREAFEKSQLYSAKQMQSIMQGLLEKTILLVYEQENSSEAETLKQEYCEFYSSDVEWIGPSHNNFMIGIIGGEEVRLMIRETYFVKNCRIRRYLPIMTAFLIMNGKDILSDEEMKIMQFSAFWIFGLNYNTDSAAEEKMREKNIWIEDILTEEEQKSLVDQSELGGLILKKYSEVLKKVFPQYTKRKVANLELEFQTLQRQSVKTSLNGHAPKLDHKEERRQ